MPAPMLTLTAAAIEQVRAALQAADDEALQLRAAARRLADGRIDYAIGLDEPRERDEHVVIDDTITVLVSPPSVELLDATVIDYVEVEPGSRRFVFIRAEAASEPDASS